uniref:Uncharacterized protein n=1 Tax=Manihot esculenta TaxID=3983 RepID=A0A2C9V0V4_MANES
MSFFHQSSPTSFSSSGCNLSQALRCKLTKGLSGVVSSLTFS